jgi:hypothetical protein
VIFKKLSKVNNRPIGKKSPNPVTLLLPSKNQLISKIFFLRRLSLFFSSSIPPKSKIEA